MIKDVDIIDLIAHQDDRGYLIEIARWFQDSEPNAHSIVHKFGQAYLVGNFTRGTVRAFHKHERMWDWFFIGHGAAKFVLSDDRLDSPTYGDMMTIVVGERSPKLIAIPPGVWHGWASLADDTQLISIASELYNREKPDEVRIPPDSFGDVWKVKGR